MNHTITASDNQSKFQVALIRSAHISPIMIAGAFVFALDKDKEKL